MAAVSALPSPASCFHCGLPVAPGSSWHTVVDGAARPMCCPGCAAVASSIVANGFSDFYTSRSEFAAPADLEALAPPELALYDDDGAASEALYSVEGIRCAACVWLIERRLRAVPGMRAADMNAATGRLKVRWSPEKCRPSVILGALRDIGYAAYPYDPCRHAEQLERERKQLFRRLFVAGLSMMQVMMYALPVYLADDGTMDADMTALMHWSALLLTLPAVAYSAQPFWRGAWNGIRQRMPGMDVPVALGIAAAFGGSVAALVRGHGDVYFDSITMFVFLLLASRYLELSARRSAAQALDRLRRALPAAAARMSGWPSNRATELVAAGQVAVGEHLLLRPGEAAAADGVIVDGATEVDLALLTGESRPQARGVGELVPGGAVNAGQPVVLRVERVAGESTLALLVGLVERAGQGKPRIALWADKVAAWFVVALLALTVLVFAFWHKSDPARAWQVAIAVLVVSCPCALSLATPTALAAAASRLLRRGVLAVQPHVLETLARVTHVVFDKTGTLTAGRPVLRAVQRLDCRSAEECLAIAAALEASSTHPLAAALREAAGADPRVAHSVRHFPGEGVSGVIDGLTFRLGSAAFAGGGREQPKNDTATHVYLAGPASVLARFELADPLREDAQAVVRHFRSRGIEVILLSGDEQPVCDRVAGEAGIARALGGQMPDQKLAFVQALQAQGAVVAMVGDGINDAAVLRAADVSFAMGEGSDLARMHSDCVLMSGSLSSLAECATTAGRTLAVIRQNLAWATLYNACAIPAAAFGLLDPWMSGVGMSLSSAVVVANALRLRARGA
ncbi:heavy metal translocating P-type ATPase [Massilia sp. R2A-15]|uniref:heavy metal translocating P-type ATPase n=1 Tax=Massilia sp. R2A-15 TaxID=3064278 RepID=UPI002732E6E1|nr:heavy metal translocating P-type ATPase [Massilia sp. R2A-15]WLI90858.1 heavy metal translocating P-type ATPase [Massilia sp. R2A-15]